MSRAADRGPGSLGKSRAGLARLWLVWDAPPAVPRRLVAALMAWPLLLCGFFLLPEITYVNVPPLFAGAGKPTPEPAPAAPPGGREVRKLAVLAPQLEGQAGEDLDAARQRRTLELRQRVGTNILKAAGYLGGAWFIVDPQQYPVASSFALKPDYGALGCAQADVPGLDDAARDHGALVALAIVAVEKFNRNAVHRWTERTYARLHAWAFGTLPDLSFGPAQMRLSTLRRLAVDRPDWPDPKAWAARSDAELLETLGRECEALRAVATFAVHQADGGKRSDAAVAAAYAGQRRRSSAPIDYAGIVVEMIGMMGVQAPE
ncbi:MAG: hypothetical protein U1E23_15395 [Reyranellaceae bacterium]